ncbi:MAG: sigma-70 family RNA polymerase sigma factor [Planctomycetota bacterium]
MSTPNATSVGDGRPQPSDAERELVAAARQGSEDAFQALLEEHFDRIYGYVRKLLRCDPARAEDLCQETFLNAWKGLTSFDGEVPFSIWLHKIARNACISDMRKSRARKRGSRKTLSLDENWADQDERGWDPADSGLDPSVRADQADFQSQVQAAVLSLPGDYREAVVLRDLQGLGYEEIAEVLGIAIGTVRSRIHRGRALLQAALGGFR